MPRVDVRSFLRETGATLTPHVVLSENTPPELRLRTHVE